MVKDNETRISQVVRGSQPAIAPAASSRDLLVVSDGSRPEFIGIGAQRCATSWLYQCLKRHPEIFMPRKECQFFNQDFDKGVDWYFNNYFKQRPPGCRVAGEFSPNYLADAEAIRRMAAAVPEAKLIVSLREPAARAYSAFKLYKSHGKYEGLSFMEAVENDGNLVADGLYASHLQQVFGLYPREQVRVYFYEEIETEPRAVLSDLYAWLGVDRSFQPDSIDKLYNLSALAGLQRLTGAPAFQRTLHESRAGRALSWFKHSRLGTFVRGCLVQRQRQRPALLADCKALQPRFRSDVLELQRLLSRDLSHWL